MLASCLLEIRKVFGFPDTAGWGPLALKINRKVKSLG